jgi:rod shape-determining protein MreC
MQKLLAFLISKRHWILFLLCEIISFSLIYRNNAYQHNMMLSSAGVITGNLSAASNAVLSYLDLRRVNRDLLERNGRLEMEVLRLQSRLETASLDTVDFSSAFLSDTMNYTYEYIPAGVANNSITYVNNYITVNKGSADGIRPDMGIISPRGVAGIIVTVSERYSVAISLLSARFKLSCKLKGTNYFRMLSWRGNDVNYAWLDALPAHAVFQVGDTVVTSGYSTIFPPGIMVGVVEDYGKGSNDDSYSLKVRLATDFQTLNALYVIVNRSQDEQKEIEREAMKND